MTGVHGAGLAVGLEDGGCKWAKEELSGTGTSGNNGPNGVVDTGGLINPVRTGREHPFPVSRSLDPNS